MTKNANELENVRWQVKHVVEYSVETTWSRLNNLAWNYFDIAQEAFSSFLIIESSCADHPGEDEGPTEHYEHQDKALKAAIRTIVFSVMACEAAIYDFSAIHLSDDYAASVLDKLDVVSKWLVAPRLICGKSLDPNGPAINALRTSVRARNALVHHKSLPGIGDLTDIASVQRKFDQANKQMTRITSNALPSFQAVILLSLELNRVLGTVAGSLPLFEASMWADKEERFSEEIISIIRRCREIDAKASLPKGDEGGYV